MCSLGIGQHTEFVSVHVLCNVCPFIYRVSSVSQVFLHVVFFQNGALFPSPILLFNQEAKLVLKCYRHGHLNDIQEMARMIVGLLAIYPVSFSDP